MPDQTPFQPSRRDAIRLLTASAAALSLGSLAGCTRPSDRRQTGGGGSDQRSHPAPPPLPREWRGVWVATVNNIDWPSRPGLPPSVQQAEIRRTVDTCARLGLNAIILQVRPTADALYRSPIEPWSAYLTGRSGRAPIPDYDPLQAWLDEAHAAGLDLHAWLNPFRARHPKSIGPDAADHVSRARPELVHEHGGYLWLDPGEPAAREYSLGVFADVLDRYGVDGLHMDDYFYPYPVEKQPFPDADTHRRYGGGRPLTDWRRSNIDSFLLDCRRLVRERRPGALFTVSPFGIWRPNNPPGIVGFDPYEGLAADSRKWLREGWVDALMPQLYWKIESPGQPFEPLLDWWRTENVRDRHLWPGLYLTRIQPETPAASDEDPPTSWEPADITRQIEIVRRKPDANGVTLFSAVGLVDNRRGIGDAIAETFAEPAFVPESPWLATRRPPPPTARLDRRRGEVRLEPGTAGAAVRRWAVQVRRGDAWETLAAPGAARTLAFGEADEVLVSAVGANGAASMTVAAR